VCLVVNMIWCTLYIHITYSFIKTIDKYLYNLFQAEKENNKFNYCQV